MDGIGTSELPDGFVLDEASPAGASKVVDTVADRTGSLPAGFVLDSQASAPQPSRPPADTGTRFSDYPKALASGLVEGVGSAVSGLGSLAKLVSPAHYTDDLAQNAGASPGVQKVAHVFQEVADAPANALQWAGNKISQGGQAIAGTESEGAQQAAAKNVVEGSLLHPSTWKLGEGATDPRSLALKGLGLVGGLAPILVAPEVAGVRALGMAGKASEAAGAAVNGIRAGMKVSEMAPEVAAQVPAILKRVGRVKQATVAAVGGPQMAEGAAQGEQARIEQMAPEDLAQLPAYQQAIAAGQTPDEARATLAQRAHDASFAATIGPSLGMSVLSALPLLNSTQGVLAKAVGTSRLKRAVAGAALEAPIQGAAFTGQNAASIAATNLATGEQRSPLEDSAATFGSGALMGGLFGIAGGLHRPTLAGPLGRAAQTAQETGAAEPFPGAAPGSLADVANVLHRGAPVDTTGDVTSSAEPPASVPTGDQAASGPALRVRVPPPLAPWVDAATGEASPASDNQVLLALHQLRDQTDALRAEGKNPMVSRPQLAAAWGIPTKRLSGLMTAANAERRRGVTTTDAQTRLDQNPGDVPQVDPVETLRASTAADAASTRQLRADQGAAFNQAGQNLADIRARLAALQEPQGSENATSNDVAKPEPPQAITDATPEPAPTDQQAPEPTPAPPATDAKIAEPPTLPATPDALPAAEPADAAKPVAPESARVPEPVATNEAGAPPARAEAASAPADQAAREVPVSSSESSDRSGVKAQTTASIGEKQPAGDEQFAAVPVKDTANTPAENQPVAAAARDSAAHPGNPRPEPTPAQQEAGNFKMGHVNLHGLDVSIEVPKGAARRGTDRAGKPWERAASDHYGYVRRTEGADGEQVDVYLGPHAEDPKSNVFVIDQVKPGTRTFDEHKAMVGYARGSDARASYAANFPKGMKTFGGIRKMSMDEFKDWVKHGDTTKPVSESMQAVATPKTREKAVEAVVAPGDRVTVTQGIHAGKAASVMGRTRNGVRLKFEDGKQATLSAKVMQRIDAKAAALRAPAATPAKVGVEEPKPRYAAEQANLGKSGTTYGNTSRVREPTSKGTTPDGAGRERRDTVSSGTLELFASQGERSAVQATRAAAPKLAQSVRLVKTGLFKSGIRRIRNWQDAAHIIAPIRKSPQEYMVAVVADADGKPLAVLRHTVGLKASSQVDPVTVAGAVAQIPGAKQVWFAHNHPSGELDQGGADRAITARLHDTLQGSGIEPRGMIVVGPGEARASFYHPANVNDIDGSRRGGMDSAQPITAASRTVEVPMVERQFRKIAQGPRVRVTSPNGMVAAVRDVAHGETGLMLLDNRHHVIGFLPMSDAEMAKLRTDDPATGAARVLRTASEANASASIPVVRNIEAGQNVNRLLAGTGSVEPERQNIRALDIAVLQPNGAVESAMVLGRRPLREESFFSRGTDSGGMDRDQLGRLVASTKRGWGKNQPDVAVVDNAEGLPAAAKRDPGYKRAEGYYDGKKVWLVASNLPNAARARQVLAHEAVGHYGVDRIVQDAYGKDAWDRVTQSVTRLDREGLGGKAMQDVLAETHRRYPDADATTFAKEAIAVMAEHGIRNGIIDRVVAAVRQYLRKIMPNLDLSAAEVRQLLARSDRLLGDGAARAQREQVRMVAAHAFDKTPDTFYSALTDAVARGKGAPKKADAAGWKQWLDGAQRRGEFKGAEREWMGLDQWLDGHKGPITRAELNDFVRENQVRVQEVMHGDEVTPDRARDIVQDEDGNFVLQGDAGETAGSAKFGEYTLPGGKNYRELLLTLPWRDVLTAAERKEMGGLTERKQAAELERPGVKPLSAEETTRLAALQDKAIAGNKPPFHSQHFDEPNIVAHVRMNDRTGPDGEKILHVEEVQSDMHQAGRKSGYVTAEARTEAHAAAAKLADAKRAQADAVHAYHVAFDTGSDADVARANTVMMKAARAAADAAARVNDIRRNQGIVPDAPFKKTEQWSMLAMKRVLRYAADHGYDKVTWTTGEQQAERYDQSHQLKSVHVVAKGDAAPRIVTMDTNRGPIRMFVDNDGRVRSSTASNARLRGQQLDDVIGKELATKVMEAPDNTTLAGNDLKFGGTGMKAFYDRMLPNELNKYAKQWGAKVGETHIGLPGDKARFAIYARGSHEPHEVFATREEADVALRKYAQPDLLDVRPVDPGLLGTAVHSIDITPAMRESVRQGQPMFARPDENNRAEKSPVLDGLQLPNRMTGDFGQGKVLTEADAGSRFGEPGSLPEKPDGSFSKPEPATPEHPADPSREPGRAFDAQANVLRERDATAFQRAKDWLSGKWEDVRPKALSLLMTNHVTELMHNKAPFKGLVQRYERSLEQLDADRQILVSGAPDAKDHPTDMLKKGAIPISDDLQRFAYGHGGKGLANAARGNFTPEAKRTFDVMHEATIAGVDPDKAYARLTIRNARGDRTPWTKENVAERLKLNKELAMQRGGDAWSDSREALADERKYLKALPRLEKKREADYARMKAKFDALPEEGKRMYRETRDWYARYSEETEKALIKNIEALDVPETYRRSLVQRMRMQFEDARAEGVYFPLNRNGDYWIAYRTPDGKNGFEMFEQFGDQRTRERELKAAGNRIDATGRRDKNAKAKEAPSGTFVRAIIDTLAKAKVSEKVQDQVYQAYLQMMPDLSMRKHAIHRGNVIGYDKNVPRTFGKFSFHGSYQLAKLRHSQDMQVALDAMGVSLDNWRKRSDKFPGAKSGELEKFMEATLARYEANPDGEARAAAEAKLDDNNQFNGFTGALDALANRVASAQQGPRAKVEREAWEGLAKRWRDLPQAVRRAYTLEAAEKFGLHEPKSSADIAKMDALLGELRKRHDWIMNPTDQQLANMVNSIGFIYYLGASPASALTNLTQIVQMTLPYLGARHGWNKASRMLWAAWRDAARTGGNMGRLLKTDEERRAFLEMQQRGIFSRTQGHTLAGVAEGNVLQGNPAWARVMNGISWMFHKAELVNRQATGMAAFRIARSEGKSFDEALEYARQVNVDTNFDYSAANRARFMQGNVPRILFQFKGYSIGSSWLFWKNFHDAFRGETPEVRRVAKRTAAGIAGMTALLAGATGLPLYNTIRMTANAANTLFGDDDQPWNFDDAFHRWLADNLGQDAARLIAEGPTNYLTGANLASRTSLANLWIHDDDQRLEGADAYHALLENIAGPAFGILQNYYVGSEDVRRGHLWRGVERMLPTSVKNSMKAMRYAHEGVNSLRGDPIVPDISGYEDFLQAIGFQPANVANQYRINTALMNFTGEVSDRRGNLMNAYAIAVRSGDGDDQQNAMRKIAAFNRAHPEVAITRPVLMSSLRQRALRSAQATNGVILNRKLAAGAREFAGVQ